MHPTVENLVLKMRSYNIATHQSIQGSRGHRDHHILTWRMSRDQATTCYQISWVLSPVTDKMFPLEASSSVCKLKLLRAAEGEAARVAMELKTPGQGGQSGGDVRNG